MDLAELYGCPVWIVKKITPASELPLWQARRARYPFGMRGLDYLLSKTVHLLGNREGNFTDLMLKDRFEALVLTEEEVALLDEEEQQDYYRRQKESFERIL